MKKHYVFSHLAMTLLFMMLFMTADAFGQMAANKDRMYVPGYVLGPGDSMLSNSNDGRYFSKLTLQTDGNLVLTTNGRKVWDSNTAGHTPANLQFTPAQQSWLRLVDTNNQIYWEIRLHASATVAGMLVLQPFGALSIFRLQPDDDDYNLPIDFFADKLAIWSSDALTCFSDMANRHKFTAGASFGSYRGEKLARMIMQADGNLIHYIDGKKVWESGTFDNPGAYVILGITAGGCGFSIFSAQGHLLYFQGGRSISIGESGHVYSAGTEFSERPGFSRKLPESSATWGTWIPEPANKLRANQVLELGKEIRSANQNYILTIQDGNLVVKHAIGTIIWKTGLTNQSLSRLVMQPDGNLVLYSATNQRLWASNTTGTESVFMQIEDDGRLVINNATSQWASDSLYAGNILRTTHQICSLSGNFALRMTYDGYLVVVLYPHSANAQIIWQSSNSPGNNICKMNADGNLTINGPDGTLLWQSNTGGNNGSRLLVQNDGNVVIYNADGVAIWDRFAGRLY